MNSISKAADTVDSSDYSYYFALHTPLVGIGVTVYEIFKKAMLSQTYTGEIGEKYKNPSDRYFVEKSYAEMSCTLVFGIGHLALFSLWAYNGWKGEALCKEALVYPENAIPLLIRAAQEFRNSNAMYLLGTRHLRNDQGVAEDLNKAFSYLAEGAKLGHEGCHLALGQLYLTGFGDPQEECFKRAADHFSKVTTPFGKYLVDLAALLNSCDQERGAIIQLIKGAPNRYANSFSASAIPTELAVQLGYAFKDGAFGTNRRDMATEFFLCAIKHLPEGPQQADAHFQLSEMQPDGDHMKRAANLGHKESILRLSTLLRNSAEEADHKEALRLLNTLPLDARSADTSIIMGHFYLSGFGCGTSDPMRALENYTNAINDRQDAKYFADLALLLQSCSPKERALFAESVEKMSPSVRWATTTPKEATLEKGQPIPPHDLALVAAKSLKAALVSEKGMLLPEAADFEDRLSLVKKLFLFSSLHTSHPLAQSQAYFWLGVLNRLMGDTERAIEHLKNYIAKDPNHFEVRMWLYDLYSQKYLSTQNDEDLRHAEIHLNFATAEKYPPAMYTLGQNLLKLSKLPTGLFGKTIEDEHTLKAKNLILEAAKRGYEPAIQLCQERKW